jgi:hypothetical protein
MAGCWRQCLVVAVCVCLFGAIAVTGGNTRSAATVGARAPAGTVPPSTTADTVSAEAVTQQFFSFTDSSRGASCDAITTPTRTIQGFVYYDASLPGPLPVLVLAHGGGGPNPELFSEAPYYASRGYFVVFPFFPVSSGLVPPFDFHFFAPPIPVPPECFADISNQPGDISFLLTKLTNDPTNGQPGLSGLPAFDPTRTGIRGISGGAITGLFFFNTCCTDSRIIAVLSDKGFAAPTSSFAGPSGTYDFSRHIALFMLNGCFDTTLDQATAARSVALAFDAWSDAGAPKYFLEDPDPAFVHNNPFPLPAVAAAAVDAFFDRYVKGLVTQATLDALLAGAGSPDYRYLTEVPGAPRNTSDPACLADEKREDDDEEHPEAAVVPIVLKPLFTG